MKTKIKVKLIGNTNKFIIREVGDWIDLTLKEKVTLDTPKVKVVKETTSNKVTNKVVFSYKLLDLGVAMELPKGYEAWVLPRSSTPSKFGIELSHSMGIIDRAYKGDNDEWKFCARANRKTTIEAGTRIAQFRIQLSQKATCFQKLKWLFSSGIKFVYVDSLNNSDRGGIGSTGVK